MIDAQSVLAGFPATASPALSFTAIISTLLTFAVRYAAGRNAVSFLAFLTLSTLTTRPATSVVTAQEVLAGRLATFALHANCPNSATDVTTGLILAEASSLQTKRTVSAFPAGTATAVASAFPCVTCRQARLVGRDRILAGGDVFSRRFRQHALAVNTFKTSTAGLFHATRTSFSAHFNYI